MSFQLEIITPEKVVFKEEVDEVSVPTLEGEITILPHHVNLLAKVVSGELRITIRGKMHPLAITGGFLEVANNTVNILADYAVLAEDIQVAKAEEAKKRAEHLMKEKVSEEDFRIAEKEMLKAILELKVANKHKRRTV